MKTSILLRHLGPLFALLCATVLLDPAAPAIASTVFDHHGAFDHHRRENGNDIVSIGHDSYLGAGETADSVVSVFGSSTSEGEAVEVVSVFGNTRVTGPVHDNVVTVLGNLYVDSKVEGDVVAVFGRVQLGPHAEIDGDVTSVLGAVHRASESIVSGDVHDVFLGEGIEMDSLHTWIHRCLLEARPLAFVSGIGWAWGIAVLCLALYVGLAFLFPSGIRQCVSTLEKDPGHSVLAALLTMLLTPVLIVLLCVTVIGIAAVPFVIISLFCLSLFGKAVILAWMGHRAVGQRSGWVSHPAVTVLIGGAVALLLYVVPVLGLLAYKVLGFFGVGAVVYALLLGQRARQAAKSAATSMSPDAAAEFHREVPATDGARETPATEAPSETPPPPPPLREARPEVLAAMPTAGFWLRMGALLIDVVLIGFLVQSGAHVFSASHHDSNFHLLVLAIYGACMWKLRGSTVGGIVCDLKVVRVDGLPIAWETAIVRALGCFLSLAVCGLGFIWIAFDGNHQAWHDKIAGTVVVRVPKSKPLV